MHTLIILKKKNFLSSVKFGDELLPHMTSVTALYLPRCVMESARLHAPGAVVRKVVKTHTIKVILYHRPITQILIANIAGLHNSCWSHDVPLSILGS